MSRVFTPPPATDNPVVFTPSRAGGQGTVVTPPVSVPAGAIPLPPQPQGVVLLKGDKGDKGDKGETGDVDVEGLGLMVRVHYGNNLDTPRPNGPDPNYTTVWFGNGQKPNQAILYDIIVPI